jgi:hypothetical protein
MAVLLPRLPMLALLGLWSCSSQESVDLTSAQNRAEVHTAEPVAEIQKFCSRCHAFPDPAAFPKEAWKEEVEQGYRFHEGSPDDSVPVPPIELTVAYFESRAPETLIRLGGESIDATRRLFERMPPVEGTTTEAASIASIRLLPETGALWSCDMRTGAIYSGAPGRPMVEVARPVTNPCRVQAADIDGDGRLEILVTDLGSFFPEDHNFGGVWCLDPDDGWRARPILSPAGRVSDVQAADFDGDGDLDLAVAEFGWRRSGRLVVLWNECRDDQFKWVPQVLDERHGSIDVPIADLNGDGRPDIVALFSQEHEAVSAYLNRGEKQFERVDIYDAEEPSFGSSGIQLVDFDGDGDLDVLHTNGDSFDSAFAKPYHGIRWLENRGEFPFVVHELAPMAGVHRAMAADLDLDGDTDVVAVSLLLPRPMNVKSGLASILWLEQIDGRFERRVVEVDQCDHAACELVDYDGDGDLDLYVGHFRWNEDRGAAATLFRNETRSP